MIQIIPQMEEIPKTLKTFLIQIAKAETETDIYKVKLFGLPGARRGLFQLIDKDHKGTITSEDVCDFCMDMGLDFGGQDQGRAVEIIGRYFRNWGQGIDVDQFCQVLQPRNLTYDSQPQPTPETATQTFLTLITTVLSSFNSLQILRQNLSNSRNKVTTYFQAFYSAGQYFSKQNLKNFMRDNGIYTRERYQLISGYIFGEVEDRIFWSGFLGKQEQEQEEEEEEQEQEQEEEEIVKPIKQIEKKPLSKPTKSCKNIEQVLNQIEQIQKQMKDRKARQSTRKEPQPQEKSQQREAKQPEPKQPKKDSLVGKVISKRKTPEQPEPFPQLNYFLQPVTQQQQWQSPTSPGSLYKPTNRCRQLSHTMSTGSLLRRPACTEAHLKIQQIQRRAMDKYLSTRRNHYLPHDGCVPYYHVQERDSQELGRLRERSRERSREREWDWDREMGKTWQRENYQTGKLFKRDNSPCQIYTRNKISRAWLYDGHESGYGFRPVSPRLLRY